MNQPYIEMLKRRAEQNKRAKETWPRANKLHNKTHQSPKVIQDAKKI